MGMNPDEAAEALQRAFPMSIPEDRASALAAARAALPRSAPLRVVLERASALLHLRELRKVRVGGSGSSRFRAH